MVWGIDIAKQQNKTRICYIPSSMLLSGANKTKERRAWVEQIFGQKVLPF